MGKQTEGEKDTTAFLQVMTSVTEEINIKIATERQDKKHTIVVLQVLISVTEETNIKTATEKQEDEKDTTAVHRMKSSLIEKQVEDEIDMTVIHPMMIRIMEETTTKTVIKEHVEGEKDAMATQKTKGVENNIQKSEGGATWNSLPIFFRRRFFILSNRVAYF